MANSGLFGVLQATIRKRIRRRVENSENLYSSAEMPGPVPREIENVAIGAPALESPARALTQLSQNDIGLDLRRNIARVNREERRDRFHLRLELDGKSIGYLP